VVLVANFVTFIMTILVMVPVTRPSTAITCLRWRRPNDQKHCQKSNYYNLTDVFHFDSPFIRISRRGEEKGYGFIWLRRHGWVEKKAETRTPHFLSLNQDIVAWSQEEKCGLKYEIYTSRRSVRTLDNDD
jgi:hypothetical protein